MAEDRRSGDRDRRAEGDERSKALREFAVSQGKVGGAISDLGVAIDYLITLAKWFIAAALVVGVLVVVSLGVLGWNAVNGYYARQRLLEQSAEIKRTADEVHSAVTPGQPIYEQGQRQQIAVVAGLVDELECRLRNALDNGPDVPGDKACLALHPELQGGSHP